MKCDDIDWFVDPYPGYSLLRQSGQPLWMPHDENYASEGVWLFSRYHEAEIILKQTSAITKDVRSKRIESDRTAFDIHMLNRDGEDHVRLRRLVTQWFSSRAVGKLEATIQQHAGQLLSALIDKSDIDYIADFAEPLPLAIIAELVGVPQADMPHIRKWSLPLSEGSDSQLVDQAMQSRRKQELSEFIQYINWLVAVRCEKPEHDLISYLLCAETRGEISREETVGMIALLLFAGHETTVSLIGTQLLLLLMHPQQWRLLTGDFSLATGAVEEALRYESPAQRSTYRFTKEAITISGFHLDPGEQLAVILGSANRDAAMFDRPDIFDIRRSPNRHLAFGIGVHNCLGKTLARVEARIALEQLLQAGVMPKLHNDMPLWKKNSFFRGLESLPLTLA